MNYIVRNIWQTRLKGLLFLAFGLLAISYSGEIVLTLVRLFGILALLFGAFSVGYAIYRKNTGIAWLLWLAEGLVNLLLGFFFITQPEISVVAFFIILGIWAILIGITQLIYYRRFRSVGWFRGISLFNGIFAILIGLVMLLKPRESASLVVLLFGIIVVLNGLSILVISFIPGDRVY